MFETKKTLIVVYKDELLMNQLKKLVETNDDNEDGAVGTRDNSINIVSWTEKVWLGNKKAGNIQGKILYLGDIKGTEKLIPVIDVQFNDCGVKYGWAGNQAVLYIEPKALTNRKGYDAFLEKLDTLPVPDILKPIKEKITTPDTEAHEGTGEVVEIAVTAEPLEEEKTPKKHRNPAVFEAAKKAIESGAEAIGKVGSIVAARSEELFRNKSLMKRQMLFYGVIHLYNDGLESFMNH
jgi:hypothetical protein